MIVNGFLIAVATLAAGLLLAVGLGRLPSVRTRLVALAVLAVGLPLASVLLSGWVMFHMGDDVKILAVSAASAAIAVVAALLLARTISRPLEQVRSAAAALSSGDLGARATVDGPTEISELAGAFNEMAESLEGLFDARRELVAWASHDLRAPLANMQAMLEAIEDGLVEPTDYIGPLHEQAAALALLVDDLFELAQIDAGALILDVHEAQLSGLVDVCLRGVQAEALQRGVHLEADVAASVTAPVAADKLERVLLNLLTNALRHTPADGTVAVRARQGDDEVRVSVEDTGVGIEDATGDRMFERFWRGDRARQGAHAGLGLAIARGLVEAHGGQIWAESRPGGGTRVSFTLPAPAGRSVEALSS